MLDASLSGIWTYRSFADRPNVVGSFERIRIWEAELYLDAAEGSHAIHGYLGERPPIVTNGSPYLNVVGAVSPGQPERVHWRGVGAASTQFEGWIYDYQGFVVPRWPNGEGQRTCIVGTVTRTVAHGEAPAGAVFSFIAVKRDFREARAVIPIDEAALRMLASIKMRLHHQLWHLARNAWLDVSGAVKAAIQRERWQPGPIGAERHARGGGSRTNGSGEDFLYMHRRMIRDARARDGELQAWVTLPRVGPLSSFAPGFREAQVGNPDGFAVPPAWVVPGDPGTSDWLHEIRRPSSLYAPFRVWEQQFTNPRYLATLSLGEMGSRIEWTIHNWMHMRWASAPRDPRTGRVVPNERHPLDWGEQWLDPEYDYLGETFSSHVHPVFWRLHGWVDDRIEDWYRAQRTAGRALERRKLYDIEWFAADGTWVTVEDPWEGPRSAGAKGSDLDLDEATMKRALTILVAEDPGAMPGRGAIASPRMLGRMYRGFDRDGE